MESSKVISTDKAIVIIQVNPQICHDGKQARWTKHNMALIEFLNEQPKPLGMNHLMMN